MATLDNNNTWESQVINIHTYYSTRRQMQTELMQTVQYVGDKTNELTAEPNERPCGVVASALLFSLGRGKKRRALRGYTTELPPALQSSLTLFTPLLCYPRMDLHPVWQL